MLNAADLLPRKDFGISLDVVQNYRLSPEFLIRPYGPPSPRGKGFGCTARTIPSAIGMRNDMHCTVHALAGGLAALHSGDF